MKLSEKDQSEIRRSYREAADKRKQIGILADLYDVPTADIFEVLGITMDRDDASDKHRTGGKRIVRSYSQAVRDNVIKAVLTDGITHAAAAEKYGVPQSNVSNWVSKARKKQANILNVADEIEAAPQPSISTKNVTPVPITSETNKLAYIKTSIEKLLTALAELPETGMEWKELTDALNRQNVRIQSFMAGMEYALRGGVT